MMSVATRSLHVVRIVIITIVPASLVIVDEVEVEVEVVRIVAKTSGKLMNEYVNLYTNKGLFVDKHFHSPFEDCE